MKNSYFFLLLFLLGTVTESSAQLGWEEFMSYEGKFRVLTPGEMQEKTQSLETGLGLIQYHSFFFEPKEKDADNLVYLLSYCDYPAEAVHSDSTALMQEFYATTIAAAVESVKGELLYQTEVFIDDYAGRYWRVDYNEGKATIKTKAYVVKNRYYSIQTITLKEKSLNISADHFLDSFSLL